MAPKYTLETLVRHEGIEEALAAIQSVYSDLGRSLPSLYLYGQAGTGKTHILNALSSMLERGSAESGAKVAEIRPEGEPPGFPALEGLVSQAETAIESLCAVYIDDIHLMDQEDALRLWTLENITTRVGIPLLMGSVVPPDQAFPHNSHLTSRILAGLVIHLEPPADAVRILILDKMAADRSVRLSQHVSHYLVTRKGRNIQELGRILDVVDAASLRLKRRITVPLIKQLEQEGQI